MYMYKMYVLYVYMYFIIVHLLYYVHMYNICTFILYMYIMYFIIGPKHIEM